jgi:hypothetical protein
LPDQKINGLQVKTVSRFSFRNLLPTIFPTFLKKSIGQIRPNEMSKKTGQITPSMR